MPVSAGVAWIVLIAVVLGAVVLLHRLIVFPARVRVDDMRPSLEPGDLILANRARRRSRVRQGDIVVFRDGTGRKRIRRVIGLPGDRVHIASDGVVMVDDEPVFEPYAVRSGGFRGSFTIPADRYFVLADRRTGSHEPQAWRESFVPAGDVIGIVRLRLLPWPIAATGVLAR